jgi:hypothetical protein
LKAVEIQGHAQVLKLRVADDHRRQKNFMRRRQVNACNKLHGTRRLVKCIATNGFEHMPGPLLSSRRKFGAGHDTSTEHYTPLERLAVAARPQSKRATPYGQTVRIASRDRSLPNRPCGNT